MAHIHHPQKKKGSVRGAAPVQKPHVHSQTGKRSKQLLLDSRSAVIAKHRADEKKAASIFQLAPKRRAQFRRIASTVYGHDQRILRALKTGELTAAHAVEELDVQQPHARFSGLRDAGYLLVSRWVRLATATGGTRLVKAYALIDREV